MCSIGVYSPLLVVLYLLAMHSVFSYGQRHAVDQPPAGERRYDAITLRRAALQFGFFAGIVTLAGIWLPIAGTRIADEMGWSRTFVGTLLVAGATSLPEVVVTMAAVHAATAFSAVMMSGAVIISLVYRRRQRLLRTLSVASAALLAVYLLNVYVLFVHRE